MNCFINTYSRSKAYEHVKKKRCKSCLFFWFFLFFESRYILSIPFRPSPCFHNTTIISAHGTSRAQLLMTNSFFAWNRKKITISHRPELPIPNARPPGTEVKKKKKSTPPGKNPSPCTAIRTTVHFSYPYHFPPFQSTCPNP